MEIENIFFDDGGVLNNNSLREKQWQKLIYEFFSPKYGKTLNDWSKANEYAFQRYLKNYYNSIKDDPDIDYKELISFLEFNWIKDMFDYLGLMDNFPDKPLKLAREAVVWITQRVESAIPGIVEVVKELANQGYKLYTASAENSWELKGYLKGMGIAHLFTEFYGLDILNRAGKDTIFYKRMFEHAGVEPRNSIVIDDRPNKLYFAKEAGATVIQSRVLKEQDVAVKYFYERAEELLPLIKKINKVNTI